MIAWYGTVIGTKGRARVAPPDKVDDVPADYIDSGCSRPLLVSKRISRASYYDPYANIMVILSRWTRRHFFVPVTKVSLHSKLCGVLVL